LPWLRASLARGFLDRVDDVLIAGAAAEIAIERVADFLLGGVGVAFEELAGSHDHAGGAEAALEAVLVPESLLDGVEVAIGGEAFDGDDVAAVGLDREHGAAFDDFAVKGDGACAADGRLAADVGAGEAGDFAKVVDEEHARFDFIGVRFAVDGQGDFSFHVGSAYFMLSQPIEASFGIVTHVWVTHLWGGAAPECVGGLRYMMVTKFAGKSKGVGGRFAPWLVGGG